MVARFRSNPGHAARCVALALLGAAGLSAQGCSPQGAVLDEGLSGRDKEARAQTADGAKPQGALDGGGRYPVNAAPLVWSERQKLLASDGAALDQFGTSVSIDGGTAFAGAPFADSGSERDTGSVYGFIRSADSWAQQAKFIAGDGATGDNFGKSVSVNGDTAIVGADRDGDSGIDSGSAYVFVRSAASWTQQQKLLADDAAADDYFGRSVSLSGNTALVGAWSDDDRGARSGSAYAFVRAATSWTQQYKFIASDGEAGDYFGQSVSISGDTALVGALGANGSSSDMGSAYVFSRSATSWTEQQKLLPSKRRLHAWFGKSVSLSGDTALVGAYGDSDFGAAYAFVRAAANWKQQQKLVAGDRDYEDHFGIGVSVDGDMALVGAYEDDDASINSGSAYVFVRAATIWTQQGKLVAIDGAVDDEFGLSVALSGDTAIVGAHFEGDTQLDSGSAYLFAPRLVDGLPCASNDGCASKFCVDGVCCDGACGGACEACNVVGLEGVCTLADRGSAPMPSCNGYLCSGAEGGCPNDCAGDQDCTPSNYCPNALGCVPKEVDGKPCGGNNVCLSGHCVSGICCAQACDGGCGSCVVAGLEGACTPLEQGHPGTPSCLPYVCGGQDPDCPSSCQGHGDCAKASHCDDGICQPDGDQGAACSEGDACATGHCTDGVCCLADACGAYRCSSGGTCEAACSSSAQCADGHQCSSVGNCEPSARSAANESGSCQLASASGPLSGPQRWRGLGGLVLFGYLGIRRRRRRATGSHHAPRRNSQPPRTGSPSSSTGCTRVLEV